MPAVEAVTLDVAGTLIAPARPVADTYLSLATPFGARLDRAALSSAFRSQFARMPPMAFGEVADAELDAQERRWWRELVKGVTDAAGGVPAFAEYFDAVYAYFASPDAWTVYDDVWPLLTQLRNRGVPMAVVSNFDSRLVPVLEGLGLADAFVAVIYSTRAGAAKPDPAIFGKATAQLRTARAACLHIGDNRTADLDGARAAGLQARLVERDPQAVLDGADQISSLTDALALTG